MSRQERVFGQNQSYCDCSRNILRGTWDFFSMFSAGVVELEGSLSYWGQSPSAEQNPPVRKEWRTDGAPDGRATRLKKK
jgi:hypothetical protein